MQQAQGRLFLNTYAPLVTTAFGRESSERFKLPPFIDGSIRCEPDLEHDFPSISCLCRADKFAPRLQVKDRIAYMTRKGHYGPDPSHWRLTAVLEVIKLFPTHELAFDWYREQSLPTPSNCMVKGNPPIPLDMSHRSTRLRCVADSKLQDAWDQAYRARAAKHRQMVVCKPLFRNLSWNAPKVFNDDLYHAFQMIPGTQNPGDLPMSALDPLLKRLGITIRHPAV